MKTNPSVFERYMRDEMDEHDRARIIKILTTSPGAGGETMFHIHGNIYELSFDTARRFCEVIDILDVSPSGTQHTSFEAIQALLAAAGGGPS